MNTYLTDEQRAQLIAYLMEQEQMAPGTGAGISYEPMVQQQQQQQQQGGMSPMQAYSAYQQYASPYMSGTAATGAGAETAASGAYLESIGVPAAAAQSGGTAAGGTAAGGTAAGGSGAGSAMAGAGPWAAIAAAIMVNEWQANEAGRRGETDEEHMDIILSGENHAIDGEYYDKKIGGPFGQAIKSAGEMSSLERAPRQFEKMHKPWEWF